MRLLIRLRRHSHPKWFQLFIGFAGELPKLSVVALVSQRVDERRIKLPQPVDQRVAIVAADCFRLGTRGIQFPYEVVQHRIEPAIVAGPQRRQASNDPFEMCRQTRSRT
jgi:hypothetical protein